MYDDDRRLCYLRSSKLVFWRIVCSFPILWNSVYPSDDDEHWFWFARTVFTALLEYFFQSFGIRIIGRMMTSSTVTISDLL